MDSQRASAREAKWLYSLGGVDIHIDEDHAFRWSCRNGYLKVAQWLYSLKNIHLSKSGFDSIQYNANSKITTWLKFLPDICIL